MNEQDASMNVAGFGHAPKQELPTPWPYTSHLGLAPHAQWYILYHHDIMNGILALLTL